MASSIINSDDGSVSGTTGLKTTGGDDGELAFESSGTEAMRIDSSGNVGVGTSSPSSKLHVEGNSAVIKLLESGGSEMRMAVTGSASYLGTYVADPLIFTTDSTERGRFDTSGNFLFNSGYGSVATAYGCRAWVNFNGTGTVAIRASGNVSSITDNGTGDYTVNFTTAMPDANYGVTFGTTKSNSTARWGNFLNLQADHTGGGTVPTSSSVRIFSAEAASSTSNAVIIDTPFAFVSIFR